METVSGMKSVIVICLVQEFALFGVIAWLAQPSAGRLPGWIGFWFLGWLFWVMIALNEVQTGIR